jgi:hypothetical protein
LRWTRRAADFSAVGARQAADLHLHQSLGGKGDHVAQNIRVGSLLHQRTKVHHGIGHRGFSRFELRNPNLSENHGDHLKPQLHHAGDTITALNRLAPKGGAAMSDELASALDKIGL